jgi:hypothetical protein
MRNNLKKDILTMSAEAKAYEPIDDNENVASYESMRRPANRPLPFGVIGDLFSILPERPENDSGSIYPSVTDSNDRVGDRD